VINDLHRSRVVASATLMGSPGIEHRFENKRVLLTGKAEVLLTQNGEEMIRTAQQLLMRVCSDIDVALPPLAGGLVADLANDGRRFAWDKPPRFVPVDGDLNGYDAILSIGGHSDPDKPITVITSSGWNIRVSSGSAAIDNNCDQTNSIGAVAAASLGVSEIFKRLIELDPAQGGFLEGLTYSLWDYEISDATGPELPEAIPANLAVNGGGAIGSGIIHGLVRLPLTGRVTVIDKQTYVDENWATCVDLEPSEILSPKAEIAARRLAGGSEARGFKTTIEDAHNSIFGSEVPWPDIVINGLDDIDARHDSQRLWADLSIDGALDADLQVRISAHAHDAETACLICTYRRPESEDPQIVQARATGLSRESLAYPERLLTDDDIAGAAPEARERLRKQQRAGKRICSVVSEAVLKELSGGKSKVGFAPSVPFAATFVACLELTELVRYVTTGSVGLSPLFQLSLIAGPQTAQKLNDPRHPDCDCVRYRKVVDRWRDERTGSEVPVDA
jgi:ThiF family